MLRLIKNDLRYHTFNKFFFIAAALLLYHSMWYAVQGGVVYELTFGIPIVCITVLLKSDKEKRSGAYCNKLTAGYTKRQVFFSYIISSAIYGAILCAIITVPMFLALQTEMTIVIYFTAFMFTAAAVQCISLLLDNILCVILAILALAAFFIGLHYLTYEPLSELRYNDVYIDSYGHDPQQNDTYIRTDNPLYVGGIPRVLLKTVCYVNPYSQIKFAQSQVRWYKFCEDFEELSFDTFWTKDEYDDIDYDISREYHFFPFITLGFTAAVSAAGYIVWRRKDLT